jgi:TonB family protein
MRGSWKRVFSAALLLSSLYGAFAAEAAGVQEDLAVVPEGVLRRLAKKTVLPDYPEASKRRGTAGRAVAQLDVDKEGRITGAYVVESPDEETKQAMLDAVRRWEFNPAFTGDERKPVRIRGKLTFYFVIDGQGARVQSPKKFN